MPSDATDPESHGEATDGFSMRFRNVDQASLFPTEDLIIPDTLRHMRKAVAAIHAIPSDAKHAHTLNSARLFDACIHIAQIDFKKQDRGRIERLKTERSSPLFDARITDIAKLAGIPGKNYVRLYKELDNLYEMSFHWNAVGEDAQVEWKMKSHFLTSLGYGEGHKRGRIRFAIEPSVLQFVLEPSNWATLSLQALHGLGTAASYALFQNTWRYVNTHAKVTAPLPTATWIELLVGKSRYVVEDADGSKRVEGYGDFKRRVLLDAIRRVNEVPALSYTLELKESHSGNRVSRLQFKFIPKKSMGLDMPLSWPPELIQVLNSIGMDDKEIHDLSQSNSQEALTEALLRLKDSESRMKGLGKQIVSKKAYLHGILANIAAGVAESEIDHDRIESEAKQQEALRAADERKERTQRAFDKHQAEVFSGKLFELGNDDRLKLLSTFDATPEGERSRILTGKHGWSPKSVGALSILKGWVLKNEPDWAARLLPNPEDRSIEAWMAWKLDTLG